MCRVWLTRNPFGPSDLAIFTALKNKVVATRGRSSPILPISVDDPTKAGRNGGNSERLWSLHSVKRILSICRTRFKEVKARVTKAASREKDTANTTQLLDLLANYATPQHPSAIINFTCSQTTSHPLRHRAK